MAECDLCGVQMNSPCSIICLSDCSVCWVAFAPAEANRSEGGAVAVARLGLKGDSEVKVTGSTEVRFCANGLTSAQIASFFRQIHPDVDLRDPDADEKSAVTGTASGTMDELVAQFGLRQPAS